jgi:hypothetical protein
MVRLDQRELELLILALRYWRAQRAGQTRRTDPAFTPDSIDVLLTKLGSQIPPDGSPTDSPLDLSPQ